MSTLGIYFGPKEIQITETSGKKLLKQVQIPLSGVTECDLEDKVPLEIKIVALFNESLRRNKIESKEAVLSLSGKDFIIRTFEIPNLPKEELPSAINFEAKKYIPFKVEELISSYQVETDRASHVNTVLFVGIKKETLDRYFFIFNQLNIKIINVEYCGFSIIRALKLSGNKDSGITGVISAPSGDGDEINFSVLENGFPLFSRDISLDSTGAESSENGGNSAGALLEKLKAEIRVSLDYYQRKFLGKNIQKMFIFMGQEQGAGLESFLNELGFSGKFIDINKVLGKQVAYSSGLIKSYSAALSKHAPIKVKVNLVETKSRIPKASAKGMQEDALLLFKDIKINYRVVVLGILICLSAFGFGIYQSMPYKQELKGVISKRAKISKIDNNLSLSKLEGINTSYRNKLNKLDNLIRNQFYLTETLDLIPRYIPDGIWLVSFSLNNKDRNKVELTLEGKAYLGDSDKEFAAVNDFLERLKQDPVFSKYFTDINILSINQQQVDKTAMTSFSLQCKNFKGER